jgi:L-histidine Nalpha-methyltransferase
MPTPPSAARATSERAFAQMVRTGLAAQQKEFQPAYFYDALGSALFDVITRLPEYTITRAETALLRSHAREIIAAAGRHLELVELGPGNGGKLALLLEHCPNRRVHLIDVSAAALESARRRLQEAFQVEISLCQAQFAEGLAPLPPSKCKRLMLFLGSNIGNLTPGEATDFLRLVHHALSPGDMFLLGIDLVKAEGKLLAAYDDPLGVTAAFNKNILLRINRELGANFDLLAFDHRALWNASASRIEMHLLSLVDQTVHIAGLKLDVSFAAGETIWTESSYKYTEAGIRDLIEKAGFQCVGQWLAEEHSFLEVLMAA